nr:hypothetical protein CFP56_42296 [Quercus suber]
MFGRGKYLWTVLNSSQSHRVGTIASKSCIHSHFYLSKPLIRKREVNLKVLKVLEMEQKNFNLKLLIALCFCELLLCTSTLHRVLVNGQERYSVRPHSHSHSVVADISSHIGSILCVWILHPTPLFRFLASSQATYYEKEFFFPTLYNLV